MKLKKIPIDLIAALFINLALFAIFLSVRTVIKMQGPPAEIAVDISNFTPPQPEVLPPSEVSPDSAGAFSTGTPPSQAVIRENLQKIAPTPLPGGLKTEPTASERTRELARIEQGIRTFDGINHLKTGLPEGVRPTTKIPTPFENCCC